MPFDKGAKRADDIASEIRGIPLSKMNGISIQINSFTVEETRTFGNMVHINAQYEDGTQLKLYTFSGVVIEQLGQLEQYLPVVVKVELTGEYIKLF